MSTLSDRQGKCLSCDSERVKIILMPDNFIHKYKMVCCQCDKYIKWISDKQSFDEQNSDLIYGLLNKDINEWERKFLESIKSFKQISSKQNDCFNKIINKYR